MIGVMTVASILALALAPVMLKQMDESAGQKEVAQLKNFAQTFRTGVLKTKTIPDQNGWGAFLATNVGLTTSQVLTNERGAARVYLIDPAFQVGSGSGTGLPYTQGTNGSIAPKNPRLMLLGSISTPLPAGLASGLASSAAAFSNIWNVAEGSVPAGWTWTGKGADLKVQRLNLDDLFLHVSLDTADASGAQAKFSIDGSTLRSVPSVPLSASFLDGTQLQLLDSSSRLQYSEILHKSKAFHAVLGRWGTEKFLGRNIQHPDPTDLQTAADAFMSSPLNPTTKAGASTTNVYSAMLLYLQDYVLWAETAPAFNNTYGGALSTAQSDLKTKSYNLISP
jgi:hypothetical protein